MALSDVELQNKLRDFTKKVMATLTFTRCRRLGRDHSEVEYEGSEADPGFVTYQWEIIAFENYEGREWARIHTHACDNRESGLGSVYTPLLCGAFLSPDGKVDYFSLGNRAASDEDIAF